MTDPKTRKFDGKIFYRVVRGKKREALARREYLKSYGFLVRVVKSGRKWEVYRRRNDENKISREDIEKMTQSERRELAKNFTIEILG